MNKQYFEENFGNVQFRNQEHQIDFNTPGQRYWFVIAENVRQNPADNYWQLAAFFSLKQSFAVDDSEEVYLVIKPNASPFNDHMFNELINNNTGSVKVYNVRAFVELTAAQAQAATCYLGEVIEHPTEAKGLYPLNKSGSWGGLSDEELRAAVDEFGFDKIILEYKAVAYKTNNGYNTEEV